jgi:hypothetical protein
VHTSVTQDLEHPDVVCLTPRLLQNAAITCDNDGVSGNDQGGIRDRCKTGL